MRLVVVAEPVHEIQGGDPRPEQHRSLPRPFDLADRALGESGGRGHAALHCPRSDPCGAAPHHLVHERVADQNAGAHELLHEQLRVVEVGDLPLLVAQEERTFGHVRTATATIDERADREMGHRGAMREDDPE